MRYPATPKNQAVCYPALVRTSCSVCKTLLGSPSQQGSGLHAGSPRSTNGFVYNPKRDPCFSPCYPAPLHTSKIRYLPLVPMQQGRPVITQSM